MLTSFFTDYSFSKNTWVMVKNIFFDSLRVRVFGIPKMKGNDLQEIAKIVLKTNLKDKKVLFSGAGHYQLMWVADLGISFNGLSHAVDKKILKSILHHILELSSKEKQVFSSYSLKNGSDIPYVRADSLPWLLYCLSQYQKMSKDLFLVNTYKSVLEELMKDFENNFLDVDEMVKSDVQGDWMDTIRRPSSTWNNLCVLKMLYVAQEMGIQTKVNPKILEEKILTLRFHQTYIVDYVGSNEPSVDGAVLALYFELFSKEKRILLAEGLSKLHIFDPCPIKPSIISYPSSFKPFLTKLTAEGFHESARWLHLGLMFLNGSKKINKNTDAEFEKINKVLRKYANFVETVDSKGNILHTILSTEYGFSMTAGQYLEYTNNLQ